MPKPDSSPGPPAREPRYHQPHVLDRPRSLLQRLRRALFGTPLASDAELEHRLPVHLALPLFASDALSSIAYATQEILIVLAAVWVVAGQQTASGYLMQVSIAIGVLMVIVAISYRKAIFYYPSGGGSYAVARENLGSLAGLVTGTALIIDYCLTVAVSASAGMAAIASIPALQQLQPYRALMAVALVVVMCWINLRGLKEAGLAFALPAMAFVVMIASVIGASIYHFATNTIVPLPPTHDAIQPMGTFVFFTLIWAFSSGSSALTGVEAISNGVNTFQPPESRNAAKTLVILICTLLVLFLGVGFAASVYNIVPSHHETLIAQLARANFGGGIPYYLTIFSTVAILLVASNTAFAGMPQLLANMARDGYVPRNMLTLGDRLVFSRSIVGLALVSCALIWIFSGNVSALIPLYAVGVFLCFTMSQAGMFKRAITRREPGWQISAAVNAVGVMVTGTIMLVLAISRFTQGAWLVVVLIPALVSVGFAVKRHYDWFMLRMIIHPGDYNPLSGPLDHLTVIVLLSSDIHRGTLEGLECARAFVEGRKKADFRALHIEIDPEKTKRLKSKWDKLVTPYLGRIIHLDIVPSPYRKLIEPIIDYLIRLDAERGNDRIVVVIPEFETGSFFTHLLHNQTASRLRKALFNHPHVTIISNRFFMRPQDLPRRGPNRQLHH